MEKTNEREGRRYSGTKENAKAMKWKWEHCKDRIPQKSMEEKRCKTTLISINNKSKDRWINKSQCRGTKGTIKTRWAMHQDRTKSLKIPILLTVADSSTAPQKYYAKQDELWQLMSTDQDNGKLTVTNGPVLTRASNTYDFKVETSVYYCRTLWRYANLH